MHATQEEAVEETLRMLKVYADFAENYMAMPVVQGEKTAGERFPGAVQTYTIEAMMQDRKALQAGTSHFLGQNFARASEIKFLDQNGQEVYAWTTSWGVSTRLIGGLLMTHADDDGLVLPPKLAPRHVVILPIYRNDEERSDVLGFCDRLHQELRDKQYDSVPLAVEIDDRDIRGGEKVWQHIKRGVPIRLEVGPRDVAADSVFMGRRDKGPKEKAGINRQEFVAQVTELLDDIQNTIFERASKFREENTVQIDSLADFEAYFTPENTKKPEIHGGFALCHWADDPATDEVLKRHKVTARCIPLDGESEPGTCIFSGQPSPRRIVLAKGY